MSFFFSFVGIYVCVCDFSIVQTWLYENLVPVYLYIHHYVFTHKYVCLSRAIWNREIETEKKTILRSRLLKNNIPK